MDTSPLEGATLEFARMTSGMTDPDLERPWGWKSYDSEGIRFAFFRAYEELLELGVKLRAQRDEKGPALSSAQRILGHYHTAYLNLQASLLRVDSELAAKSYAEEEWSIRRTLAHIIGGDLGFYVAIKFALDQHRAGEKGPAEISDEAWDSLSGLDEDAYKRRMASDFDSLQVYHRQLHQRILREFTEIGEDELEIPSRYWETEAMSIRFRLQRFPSHMRQHTIQIEKTMAALGPPSREIDQLLSMIYQALSDAEGARIGAWDLGDDLIQSTAKEIKSLAGVLTKE